MELQPIDFWKRVNSLIKSNSTKQQIIAESCNIPYQTFRGWITRKVYPDALQTYKIARALDTTVEYLVTGEDSDLSRAKLLDIKEQLLKITSSI